MFVQAAKERERARLLLSFLSVFVMELVKLQRRFHMSKIRSGSTFSKLSKAVTAILAMLTELVSLLKIVCCTLELS